MSGKNSDDLTRLGEECLETQLTASDQLLLVYTCLPNATLILFELLTTAPVNALYYTKNFQGHQTENAFI